MPFNTEVKITEIEKLNDMVYRFACKSPEISQAATAGQFVNVQVVDMSIAPLLKRPISIYNIDKKKKIIEFIFQVRGRGTKILADKKVGENICVLGPLGKGFSVGKFKNIAIIGGGIGIFPLYELAKESKKVGQVTTYLGFRDKSFVILEDEFKGVSHSLVITTDNGTYGQKGYGVDYLQKDIVSKKFDAIFACGPLQMLSAVQKIARDSGVYCEVSLEERMGCSVGACMGCSVRLVTDDGAVKYARVCKDGPVFAADSVIINDGR